MRAAAVTVTRPGTVTAFPSADEMRAYVRDRMNTHSIRIQEKEKPDRTSDATQTTDQNQLTT